MLIHDNYRGTRVLPDMIEVAPEPESRTRTWIMAAAVAIGVFGLSYWWLT